MGSRISKHRAPAAALAAVAALAVGGCGGSSTPNTAAGRAISFDQCLQSHGITLPTSGTSASAIVAAEMKNLGKVEAAVRACASQLGIKTPGLPSGL
jgi:hypothetical protein